METLKKFNPNRPDFAPYGLTCEKWLPIPASRLDRHNEIELLYFPEGGSTILVNNNLLQVPGHRLIVFWALLPHKTISFVSDKEYFTCTIPLYMFLSWAMDKHFQEMLLQGEVLAAPDASNRRMDELQLNQWWAEMGDSPSESLQAVVADEMRVRLKRLALNCEILNQQNSNELMAKRGKGIYTEESDKLTRIAYFIATHFNRAIKAKDIGEAVGLHPDYANTLCRKAFGCTLHECVLRERVNHVERMLITTDLPITEISARCGFSTIARFNATFLKQKGCTPSEYRKQFGSRGVSAARVH
ncbi:MAG: helix-turn-helix domain-containing protein [Bacteroidaceae bacterium]